MRMKKNNVSVKKLKFNTGDKVRISRIKGIFEKGYINNWSYEIFDIYKIKCDFTNPTRYYLKDYLGNEIKGCFYEEELNEAKCEIYLIENVLRSKTEKGKQIHLVKLVGFDDTRNTWITDKQLMEINKKKTQNERTQRKKNENHIQKGDNRIV